ncbi:MAG: hypothetical protein HXX12_06580 [Geothrix sp.]|uniref:hypothetical protein n=1 Tax=Geothrix sp. TaxID=1962974 RepID=UPI00181049D5|nr:hypothetical protein [Geothrix sp.]NWJ40621.1 hypothetical protein [Geothrix sp.]WIL21370.1 MAG: hypothetical protein QOZ81_000629 [Geothrix sp.]
MSIPTMKALASLFAGAVVLCVGVYWLKLGRVWDNIYGWTSKEDRPLWFWFELISVFVISAFMIAYALIDFRKIIHS